MKEYDLMGREDSPKVKHVAIEAICEFKSLNTIKRRLRLDKNLLSLLPKRRSKTISLLNTIEDQAKMPLSFKSIKLKTVYEPLKKVKTPHSSYVKKTIEKLRRIPNMNKMAKLINIKNKYFVRPFEAKDTLLLDITKLTLPKLNKLNLSCKEKNNLPMSIQSNIFLTNPEANCSYSFPLGNLKKILRSRKVYFKPFLTNLESNTKLRTFFINSRMRFNSQIPSYTIDNIRNTKLAFNKLSRGFILSRLTNQLPWSQCQFQISVKPKVL